MLVLIIFLILVNVYHQNLSVYWTSFLIIGGSLLFIGVIYKIKLDRNPGKLYEFYVGDSIFRGRAGYGGLSKIVEGDSIFVAYDYTNPGNSEIVGYFEYALDRSKLPDTVFYRRQMNKMRKPLE